ncbi:MAG: hypothetical protein WKF89_11870 [Chitinophagaceae bacterium]
MAIPIKGNKPVIANDEFGIGQVRISSQSYGDSETLNNTVS